MAMYDMNVETSALCFAAAVHDELARSEPAERIRATRARVELVLVLARHSIDAWEPDVAYSLLDAAWRAIENVWDDPLFDETQERWIVVNHAVDLRRAVRLETRRLLGLLGAGGVYYDHAWCCCPTILDDVRALCRIVDRFIAREETEP